MRRLRGKLSYANVMATIAVFVALGGGAYAAAQLQKNSVGTAQLKKSAVTGVKVKDGSLSAADIGGAVISANHATTAGSAAQATNADSATRATNADSATNASRAADADQLGGSLPSAYIKTSQIGEFILAPHFEHANFGCPFDLTIWHDSSPEVNEVTGYWRDPYGVVHLRGYAIRCGTAETTIFTLPAGFRPGKLEHFVAFAENPTPKTTFVTVGSTGLVVAAEVASNGSVALDGISFKCAPSGANGCP